MISRPAPLVALAPLTDSTISCMTDALITVKYKTTAVILWTSAAAIMSQLMIYSNQIQPKAKLHLFRFLIFSFFVSFHSFSDLHSFALLFLLSNVWSCKSITPPSFISLTQLHSFINRCLTCRRRCVIDHDIILCRRHFRPIQEDNLYGGMFDYRWRSTWGEGLSVLLLFLYLFLRRCDGLLLFHELISLPIETLLCVFWQGPRTFPQIYISLYQFQEKKKGRKKKKRRGRGRGKS